METKLTENQFEEFEKYEALSDQDVFTKIWTQPRKVFKFINDTQYEKYFYILLFFAGVVRALDRASTKNTGDDSSLFFILFFGVVLGGAFGWISYFIYAALTSWTGKWLDGAGDTTSIFRMMAYALLPSTLALVFIIPQIAIFGVDVFRDVEYDTATAFGDIVFWISVFCEVVLSLTTLVLWPSGFQKSRNFRFGKLFLI